METGVTEGESEGDERNRSAPKEPPTGENGKKGKERAEKLSSQMGIGADERKRRGTEKAEKKGTQGTGGRQAPGKRLREQNWEGRKETSRKAKYGKRKGSTGNRAKQKWKAREAKAEMAAPGKQL